MADALWSDEAGVPMLALAADCVPILLAAPGAVGAAHAGWRGTAKNVAGAAVAALARLGARPSAMRAWLGPSIGPCCYEVGPEVSGLFDRDLTREGNLDLWSASERALTGAGVASVERLDLCTRCHPEEFFSHRYSGPRRGAQGVIGAVAG